MFYGFFYKGLRVPLLGFSYGVFMVWNVSTTGRA